MGRQSTNSGTSHGALQGALSPWAHDTIVGHGGISALIEVVGTLTLMDGGRVSVPSNGVFSPDGRWAVENEGVAPDVVVEQDPATVRAGRDPQLEKAIEVVMDLLKKNPPSAVKRPRYKRLR